MASSLKVNLFCEDAGHEQFVSALVRRLASEEKVRVALLTPSSRGGHGKAVTEFRAWQKLVARGVAERPDMLVLVIDANCTGWPQAKKTILATVDGNLFPCVVVGCPEPHIERWCIADPGSFFDVVGGVPQADPGKCDRNRYKQLLRQSIEAAGQPILTNEMEYAPDLVQAMDLHKAGRNQASLKHFVDELRHAIKSPGN